MQALEKIIQHVGGPRKLADALGVTPMSISHWRKQIPAERVIALCKLSGGQVKPHELRPDIYPDPAWEPEAA